MTRPLFLFLLLLPICIAWGDQSMTLNLMPVPEKVTLGEGRFILQEDFTMAVRGTDHPRIYRAATRALRRLSDRTGLFFPQDFITPASPKTGSMVIEVKRVGQVKLKEDESYQLIVSPSAIVLKAETDIGALRGLETFLQLLSADKSGYYFPCVTIQDKPRFPWRGLLIDVCRHWQPMEVIKRNLDGMAAVKLNVLHLHITEDQGFRIECRTFPKLHEMGSDGNYFTHEQIKEIIAYAADRGIRVMPEFDIPGHSTSWFVGYPEYASAPGPYTIERRWGIMDPTFNPTIEKTYKFFDAFFKEMSALFPDEYIHIGGDENNGKQWDANPQIQAFMKKKGIKSNHELQSYFNKRILAILTKYGKKMVGWDEILQPDSPKDIVIQSWRGRESLIHAAQNGWQVILSNGYYIDLMQPTTDHYFNDPLTEDMGLTAEQARFILGGEATMWSEMVTPENIDSRIWPRTAAIAERLWSPAHVRDADDMYRRLEVVSFRLEELGLTHEKNYEMMLRRLTDNLPTAPLRTLVDVVEPLKYYQRGQYRDFTQYSPYTRVMDAARPDAAVAREFRRQVDRYLAGGAKDEQLRDQLVKQLQKWEKNHERLLPIIDASPILREIEPLSRQLSECAASGLRLIKAVEGRYKISADERAAMAAQFEEAKKQVGQVELMIVPALEKLLAEVGKNN
ncbi:MAG: family 20 glycosylhydrolase [candidate division KSB1 bacterium]|nr:family 20 glycosylhydrolase [candidate division KSB1 bacterium]